MTARHLRRRAGARRIAASGDRLVARATGEVELEDRVLVVRRIRVRLELKATAAQREVAERVHGVLAGSCPLHRTPWPAIAITTELAPQEGARPTVRGPGPVRRGGAPPAP